ELLADHGGRLQHVLLALRQPIDARAEHDLDRRRQDERLHRGPESIRAPGAVEAPGVGQRLDDLLGEERVACRALADALDEPRDRRVGAEELAQQRAARLRAEGQERQLAALRLLPPASTVLRA